eukprot:768553-Hanusia_phi.AAC.1
MSSTIVLKDQIVPGYLEMRMFVHLAQISQRFGPALRPISHWVRGQESYPHHPKTLLFVLALHEQSGEAGPGQQAGGWVTS